jgi:hypothetical protein
MSHLKYVTKILLTISLLGNVIGLKAKEHISEPNNSHSYTYALSTIYYNTLSGLQHESQSDAFFWPVCESTNHLFFFYSLKSPRQTKTAYAAGLGLRQTLSPTYGLGGYFSLAQDHTPFTSTFLATLGIEVFSQKQDFRLNAYIPLANAQIQKTESEIMLSGHKEQHTRRSDTQELGTGFDFRVSRQFSDTHPIQIYGGGYYFLFPTQPTLCGALIGLEYPLGTTLKCVTQVGIDTIKSYYFTAGVQFRIGCPEAPDGSLKPKFRQFPVQYLVSAAHNCFLPHIITSKTQKLSKDNIWFFSSQQTERLTPLTVSTGTAENPLSTQQLNTQTLAEIQELQLGATLYLANSPDSSPIDLGTLGLVLPKGQSLLGRSTDFKSAAPFNARPVLIGTLILSGDHQVEAVKITVTQPTPLLKHTDSQESSVTGIMMQDVQNITLQDVTSQASFQGNRVVQAKLGLSAAYIKKSDNIHWQNCQLSAKRLFDPNITKDLMLMEQATQGLYIENGKNITTDKDTQITTVFEGNQAPSTLFEPVYGIQAIDQTDIIINNSRIAVQADTTPTYTILLSRNSRLTAANNQWINTGKGDEEVVGLWLQDGSQFISQGGNNFQLKSRLLENIKKHLIESDSHFTPTETDYFETIQSD